MSGLFARLSLKVQEKRYANVCQELARLEADAVRSHEAVQDEIVKLAARGQQHYNIVTAAKARLA